MSTWKDRKGQANLRSFTTDDGNVWLEQNASKNSRWAKFAREGHDVAWEFEAGGGYSGRMLVDGEVMTPKEATSRLSGTISPSDAKSFR
jgi:hypothetical protein